MNGPQEQLAAYREAVVKNPVSAAAHYELGNALLSAGQSREAAACLESAVALQPGHADAQYRLAYAYSLLGRLDDARGCCLKAIALQPDHAQAYFHLGKIYTHQNQFQQAAACFRQAGVLRPDFAKAHSELGRVWVKLGNPEEALGCFRTALELAPGDAETLYQCGITSIGLGRAEEALSALRRAIALRPDFGEAYNGIGNALLQLGRPAEAIPHYHQALALNVDPGLVSANLGTAHDRLGQTDEAIRFYSKALTTHPDNAELHQNLGTIWSSQGGLDEALRSFEQALMLRPDFTPAYDSALLCLLYADGGRRASPHLSARDYARRYEQPLRPSWPTHTNNRDPERRLKVGYVSADFRLHSVAYFMEPLLAHHDKRAVEVYCYYSFGVHDAVTARLMAYADHWRDCAGLADSELAARIQADGIDILVDLAGHTGSNRLPVFARKPAPVQVTYLGYPATTGLSAIDYRLVTADTDPPGAEAWHSERLYRLPRSLWCYRPPATMPAVIPATPARRSGCITFGAMNNVAKVSDATVATWAHLLRAVPGAQLVMTKLADSAQRLMHEHFATQGIAAERLILHGKLPAAEYYALLNAIDIALDPFPYTGTTTTCESLWMGVPVVTLIGETSVARSGYALLKGIGLEELAARDEKEYVAIAAALAQDLDRLDALRGGMRQRIASSPLRDEAGLTRDLEAAYRAMWRAWCDRGEGE